eukprot:TRINITY_DN1639_c2_g1_i1.p1 TRINITY_DN1639_c2_g1~~TRINITY_DN1639_c2_g1_i1.p1  ORF type:complete len:635 (-),score=201.77 TRINITY_DN1639_c2_g1_i1:12-1916(-)
MKKVFGKLFSPSRKSEEELVPIRSDVLEASRKGDLKQMKKLLGSLHADDLRIVLDARDEEQKTPLFLAVEKDDLAMAEFLFDKGTNGNSVNSKHLGPIHHAAINGKLEMTNLLLHRNRDAVYSLTGDGKNALQLALLNKHFEVFCTIINRCGTDEVNHRSEQVKSYPVVYLAIEHGLDKYLEEILKKSPHLNLTTETKETPLHVTCRLGRSHQVAMLLKHGANPTATTEIGETALHYACRYGHEECVTALFQDPNVLFDIRDTFGRTPLMWASTNVMLKTVEFILKNCQPEHVVWKDKSGKTALDYCVHRDQLEIYPHHIPIGQHPDKEKREDEIQDENSKIQVEINLKKEFQQKQIDEKLRDQVAEALKTAAGNFKLKDEKLPLQICSDLHIEFYKDNVPEVLIPSAPYLCLLGDIGVVNTETYSVFLLKQAEIFKHVFVVAGNHEFYGSVYREALAKIKEICDSHPNLTFMHRTSVSVEGVRILGMTLWSEIPPEAQDTVWMGLRDFRMIRLEEDKNSLILVKDYVGWHQQDMEWLQLEIQEAKLKKERVLVLTHHAPLLNFGSSEPQFFHTDTNSAFCTDLRKILGNPIDTWAYGHTHWFQDMTVNGTRVVSNPRGYITKPAYDPSFVIHV